MRARMAVAIAVPTTIVALLIVDAMVFTLNGDYIDRVLFRQRYDIRRMHVPRRRHRCRAAIICLARSVGDKFPTARERVRIMADSFQECRIVFVENDSNDDTRPQLCKWAAEDSRVEVVPCPTDDTTHHDLCAHSCTTGAASAYALGAVSDDRIHRMAKYRNTALDYVKAMRRKGEFAADVVVVYDFDIGGNMNMNAFHDAIHRRKEWDAIFANGRMAWPPMGMCSLVYDALAFMHRIGDTDSLGRRALRQTSLVRSSREDMIPVASAFNGLAMYDYAAVEGCKYSVPPPPYNCEHVGIHLDMARQGFSRMFIFKPLVLWAGAQGPNNKLKYFL